jgi:hypothetical protein
MALPWYDALLRIMCVETTANSYDVSGMSLFFVARIIANELQRVRELTEIKHKESEDRMISQGTEDGMHPSGSYYILSLC